MGCNVHTRHQVRWSRMSSFRMLRRVALVRVNTSEEPSVSIIRVARIGKLGTTLAVTRNRLKSQRNTKKTFFTAIAVKNLKSYLTLTGLTLYPKRNVSPVRYELDVYIPHDGILHSFRR
jgi:hypothetical protein